MAISAFRKRSQAALTLVEVLAVMAILLILLAILLPVISKAKKRAQEVGCQQKLKQLYHAMQIYSDAYGSTSSHIPGIPLTLPRNGLALKKEQSLPESLYRCSDMHPQRKHNVFVFMFSVPATESQFPSKMFSEFAAVLEEQTPLIVDLNHRNEESRGYEGLNETFAYALLANGSIVTSKRRGSAGSFSYWLSHFGKNKL